jgi:aspartate racemase
VAARRRRTAGELVNAVTKSMQAVRQPLIGVVGGMGPLASARLLQTVYALGAAADEQQAPRILLWSDPQVIDRTEALESGRLDELRQALARSVGSLVNAGASRVLIACLTAHVVLGDLPSELTERCVSLVDIVFGELAALSEPHLLLCTRGTARSGLFAARPGRSALPPLVELADADQDELHEHIYRLKRNADPAPTAALFRTLLPRYGVRAFVAACTELHMVTGLVDAPGVDPMLLVARRIADGTL